MTLAADSAANKDRLVAQLYDEWQGYYMLQQAQRDLFGVIVAYVDVRQLSREEALSYRCKAGEALRLVYPTINKSS